MYKNIIFTLVTVATALLMAITASAQASPTSQLSTSTGGKRVLGYFGAFNDADEKGLASFFQDNLAEDSLKARPVEARVEAHRGFREHFGKLEIVRVLKMDDDTVSLAVKASKGQFVEFIFKLTPKPDQKIVSMGIEDRVPDETSTANEPKDLKELPKAIDELVGGRVKADAFSGVVYVARKDKVFYYKAFGEADKTTHRPNQLDTPFNLGSINKAFTRIAIGQLIQAGKISWNDKLGKYLPDYPNKEAAAKVTIDQLINMRSGIGDFFGDKFAATPKEKFRTIADYLPMFADQPLAFEPGTDQKYSNGGYVVLGAIIEKVTGQSYYEYVRENIFKPLGMNSTASYSNDEHPANTANGYSKENSPTWTDNTPTRPWRGSSAGGGYSNVPDLVKFATALRDHKLIALGDDGKPETEVHMMAMGGAPGINAAVGVDESRGDIVIVLANYDPPAAGSIAIEINKWLKDLK